LKKPVFEYLPDCTPNNIIFSPTVHTDENGDQYELYHGYQVAEYDFMASFGWMNDDALELFQEKICSHSHTTFFHDESGNESLMISTQIQSCSVGQPPQLNDIQFPYRRYLKYPNRGTNFRCQPLCVDVKFGIWLREMPQTLSERFYVNQERELIDYLLENPDQAHSLPGFLRICYAIHKTVQCLADEIRTVEDSLKSIPSASTDQDVPHDETASGCETVVVTNQNEWNIEYIKDKGRGHFFCVEHKNHPELSMNDLAKKHAEFTGRKPPYSSGTVSNDINTNWATYFPDESPPEKGKGRKKGQKGH